MTFDFEDVDSTSRDSRTSSPRRSPRRSPSGASRCGTPSPRCETSTVATTDEVFVGDIEGDQRPALVVLDIELTSTGHRAPAARGLQHRGGPR